MDRGSGVSAQTRECGACRPEDLPLRGHSSRLDRGWRSLFANSTQLRGALADFREHTKAWERFRNRLPRLLNDA